MKITVINGTMVKGCTFHMKETFLNILREGNEIREFYLPKDFPHFCVGCKTCILKSEDQCPHATHSKTIWNAICQSDLLVFAYPIYVSGVPGQLKALLDHFACHHMVHRPDKTMFDKRAIILTQSLRSSNRAAQKEVANNLRWIGISNIKSIGFTLKDNYMWKKLPQKRREKIEKTLQNIASEYLNCKTIKKGIRVKGLFIISKILILRSLKKTEEPSADAMYWHSQGWI